MIASFPFVALRSACGPMVWTQATEPPADPRPSNGPVENPAPAESGRPAGESTTSTAEPGTDKKLTAERRDAMNQAVELLIWVLTLGVILILATMWAGARWRRRLRESLPPVSRPDELWFLKHPPNKES